MLYTFGGAPSAVLTDAAGNVIPDYPLNVLKAGTGELVTALLEADGTTPIGELRSNPADSSTPGAIRVFTIVDVRAIEYQYLDAGGNQVTWYEQARELGTTAVDTATAANTTAGDALDAAEAASTAAAAAQAAADAAQDTADDALTHARMPGWYVVTDAAADGVTDDSTAIQTALSAAQAAGGGTVLIPPGSYAVAVPLKAFDNTVIYAYGATLTATGNNGLLHNYVLDDAPAGYTGPSHITVLGGVWDGNAGTGPGQTSGEHDVVSFNHCADITCRDMVIRNTPTAHALEFNACDGGRAINCRFEGFADLTSGSARQFSEAVQIDIAVSGSSAIGPFDGTPSKNILIEGCYCGPSDRLGTFGRFVGSHTVASGTYYDGIEIRGNVVEGTIQEGIHGYGWRHVVITDNVLKDTGMSGIWLGVPDPGSAGYSLTPDQIVIADNIVDGVDDDSGIRVIGYATALHTGVRISGNSIDGQSSGTANGIDVEYCTGPGIVGNTVENMASAGIFVNHCTDAVVDDNVVRSTGTNAINATSSPGTLISGNTVDGTSTNYGIFATSSDSCSITGNRITAASTAGIRLSVGATGALVVSNQVRKGSGSTGAGITLDATATGSVLLDNDLTGNGWSASTALGVATAAPTTGPGGMTALPGSNLVDTDLTPLPALESAMRPAGRYETTSRLRLGSANQPSSGVLYLVPIWLPAGLTVSNISFISGGTAATSPTNWWFTLHDSNRVALARTADQTTTAWAATTTKTLAIAQTTAGTASSYTTTYTGLHYLGVMIAASTTPSLASEGSTYPPVAQPSPGFGACDSGKTTPPTVTSGAFTAAAFSGSTNALLLYGYVS